VLDLEPLASLFFTTFVGADVVRIAGMVLSITGLRSAGAGVAVTVLVLVLEPL
jgi:hypothetical protein